MRTLILSTLSTLALLIYPLSLSAQNSFSLSVDVDDAAGDQAVTSLNTAPDQVIAIQIFGKDIQNANGLSVRFEYDVNQVTYEGFDVGDVLPNAQALPEQGTGYVEIGMASLGGQATANSGLVGTARFRTTAVFSGTAIRLVRAELSRSGRFETIMLNIRIALQGAPTPANFSVSLDVDSSAGDQAVTSVGLSTDEIVAIEIFGTDIQNANGVSIRFEYDASQVAYEGFDTGDVLPNAQALPSQGTNPTYVEIGIASLGGQATANSGLIGTIRFRTTAGFSGTEIRLVRAELGRGGRFETITIDVRVELKLQALTPDFNGDGVVNFADFLLFGGQFGSRQGDGRYEAKYDLDSDGAIGFGDFLIFGKSFGKEVPPSGGNGSGGSGGSTIVDIPDANLRAAIETALGKTSGAPISRAEMASLTRLEAPGKNIRDLTGLAFATQLTLLNLNNNIIADISPLAGLPRLTSLRLDNNIIVDVSALSGMTNLTYLYLTENLIADVPTLSGLTKLTRLELSNNIISDITPLSGLINLESLTLHRNAISDFSPLPALTNLKTLGLHNTTLSDVSPLRGLTNLESVNLTYNSISDVSPLRGLTNLIGLFLNTNAISDLTPLNNLTNLANLQIWGNNISDLSPLANLTNLQVLYLHRNPISDVSPLANLTNLRTIGLNGTTISDMSAFVSALSNLTNLRSVLLGENGISDISALASMTNLTTLYLHKNAISDVSVLSNLTNLTHLLLYTNSITDLSPLVANTGLDEGDRIDVRDNPLSDTSLNTHIPALQARGVTVQFGAGKSAVLEKETSPPRGAVMNSFGGRGPQEGEYIHRR